MRSFALFIALALVASACGGGEAVDTTTTSSLVTTTSAVVSTTIPEATTTTAAATTTTLPPVTTTTAPRYLVPIPWAFPSVFGASGDPHGSGCSLAGDALTDGVWFGYAEGVGGGKITFDLACYFTGPAAVAAAAADGEEAVDFYIRNQNPKVFSVAISPLAQVFYIPEDSEDVLAPEPIAVTSWPTPASFLECPGTFCGVWLYVNGGEATGIVEMYQP